MIRKILQKVWSNVVLKKNKFLPIDPYICFKPNILKDTMLSMLKKFISDLTLIRAAI
jgi:hypothetical protein